MRIVRPEQPGDIALIRSINQSAFPTPLEANLVDALRECNRLLVSLVSEEDGNLTGHIAFSKATIDRLPDVSGAGLGPMAVAPSEQSKGIGSELVRSGIEACRRLDLSFLIVLGHPGFYPRFGFIPASRYGIRCFWDVPDDVFMAMELKPGALAGPGGMAHYEPEFYELE